MEVLILGAALEPRPIPLFARVGFLAPPISSPIATSLPVVWSIASREATILTGSKRFPTVHLLALGSLQALSRTIPTLSTGFLGEVPCSAAMVRN